MYQSHLTEPQGKIKNLQHRRRRVYGKEHYRPNALTEPQGKLKNDRLDLFSK